MGLSFGWKAAEVRESIWKSDDALKNVSRAALAAWDEDGDASHLRPFATEGRPQVITFRSLTPDETRIASGYFVGDANAVENYGRAILACFRIGVDFADLPTEINDPNGTGIKFSRIVKERGVRMLANEFVTYLERTYPGMVAFYGGLILRASFATEVEKKASSQPSTPTSSSVEATIRDGTESPQSKAPEAA